MKFRITAGILSIIVYLTPFSLFTTTQAYIICKEDFKTDQIHFIECISGNYPDDKDTMFQCYQDVFKKACGDKDEGSCCLCPTDVCQVLLCWYEKLGEEKVNGMEKTIDECAKKTGNDMNDDELQGCFQEEMGGKPQAAEMTDKVMECVMPHMGMMGSDDRKEKCEVAQVLNDCLEKSFTPEENLIVRNITATCLGKLKKPPMP